MKRTISPESQKAGHEATKRREREEAEARGWKPGDPWFVSQELAMDLRQEQAAEALRRRIQRLPEPSGPGSANRLDKTSVD